MELQVLGPVRVTDEGAEVSLGGARQRRLLAVLVLGDGRAVAVDSIVDAVWGDGSPPDGAVKTLQSYVSRLRGSIGETAIDSAPGGYRLRPGPAMTIDAQEFERTLRETRQAQPLDALPLLEDGLARWRGTAYGEYAHEPWCRPAAARLDELRLAALEQRCQALLELGRHGDAAADLERLVAEHPLRERFRSQLMLSLHRSGRQVEALRAFQTYRNYLADETGLEPSLELVQLERKIAVGDPSLRFLASGRALRGYVLTEPLGEGAFGTVYRALQPSVGREVAVKVVRPELADDPAYVRRFEGEARLVARLEHPHIVPLYDFWREPGGAYLVFRMLKGGSVEDSRSTPWPVDRVSRLVTEIGSALAVAHAADVVHRDVKPANLLFDETGNCYLADFGIALHDLTSGRADVLRSAGTPLYASPEQLRGEAATARADQYALAVVAWELLVGRAPFEASKVTELVRDKLVRGVPDLSTRRPDLPAALSAVLQRATSIDPDRRFPGMTEFVAGWTDAAFRSTATTTGDLDARPAHPIPPSHTTTMVFRGLSIANPYKGLRAFDEGDAAHFFGRDGDIRQLAERLADHRVVMVVGPSGSGKSSLVRAGLIPQLRDEGVLVTTTVPGSEPLDDLMEALLRVAVDTAPRLRERLGRPDEIAGLLDDLLPPGELVLVIDQLEELWTQTAPPERARYLEAIRAIVTHPNERVRIVATVRADFYDRPLADRVLGPLVGATLAITPLAPADLAEAIAAPSALVGVRAEDALIATLAHEVASEPSSLPLLQYTLTELFERRTGSSLALSDYEKLGGLEGVVQHRAEAILAELGDGAMPSARRLFGQLVTPGAAGQDTRRRTRRAELATVPEHVIEAFGEARLLTFDVDPHDRSGTVEIAHEALLVHWPRLRGWLEEDREQLRRHRELVDASRRWVRDGRLDADLLRGERLSDALAVAGASDVQLDVVEREYLDISHSRVRRVKRLRNSALIALATLTVVALVAAGLAISSSRRADRNAESASANALAAQRSAETADRRAEEAAASERDAIASERDAIAARDDSALRRLAADAVALAPTQREVSLLLAVESFRRRPDVAGEGALAAALTSQPGVLRYVDIGIRGVQAQAAIAADAGVIALTVDGDDIDPAIVLLDADTLTPTGTVIDGVTAGRVAVRPDGREIATSGVNGGVRRWDARTGDPIGPEIKTAPTLVGAWPITYLPDGTLIVTSLNTVAVYPPGADGAARTITLPGVAWAIGASPSGASVAVAVIVEFGVENQVLVVDTSTWQATTPLTGLADVIYAVDFLDEQTLLATDLPRARAPRLFAVGMGDGSLRTIDLPGLPLDITVLRDRRILVNSIGSYVIVDAELTALTRPSAIVGSFAELDDGRLLSTSNGGLLVIDPDERSAVAEVLSSQGEPLVGFAATNVGQTMLVIDGPQGMRLHDAISLAPLGPAFSPPMVGIDGKIALSPDGAWIAVTGTGETQLYSSTTGEPRWSSPGPGDFNRPIFSPDGSAVVVAGRGGDLTSLASSDGRVLWTANLGGGTVLLPKWSDDGRYITMWRATTGQPAMLDARTGRAERVDDVGAAAVVSPDGTEIAIVGQNADLRLVALDGSGVRVLAGGAGLVDAQFSADGRLLVGNGLRGEIRVVDVASGAQIGPGLAVSEDFTVDGSTTLVGSRLVVGGLGREIVAYEFDPTRRAELACEAAGRNLTRDEWERYLGDLSAYRATCDQYPVE